MTAILLWAIFMSFFLLVLVAPAARWVARNGRREPARRRVRAMRD